MIVLDTHALLWWVSDPDKIPRRSRRLLDKAIAEKKPIAVSSISLWEISMLVERGRLQLTMPVAVWISHLEAIPWLSFVPVDERNRRSVSAARCFPASRSGRPDHCRNGA